MSTQTGDLERLDDKTDDPDVIEQSYVDPSAETTAVSPETEEAPSHGVPQSPPPTTTASPPPGPSKDQQALLQVVGPSYARTTQFWKLLLFSSALQGTIMGFIALGFLLGFNSLADRTWKTDEYDRGLKYNPSEGDDETILDVFRIGQGPWWYVGLLSAAGFLVGTIKVVWTRFVGEFPEKLPGFINDIVAMKSDDILIPIPMMICSIVSIGSGAVVGPEAALGAMGSAVGTVVGQRWQIGSLKAKPKSDDNNNSDQDNEAATQSWPLLSRILPDFRDDVKSCNVDGLVGAFGPLFPSQILSPLLIFELGMGHFFGPGGLFTYTEQIAKAGVASSLSYVIFTGFEKQTFLAQVPLPEAAYEVFPVISSVDLAYGAIMGVFCGLCGFVGFFLLAIGAILGKKVFDLFKRLGGRLGIDGNTVPFLLTPTVGGALVGLLAVLSPLILSDGSDQLQVIASGAEVLGAGTLVCAAVCKLLAVGISLGFGFVGGQIFPFIFAGSCIGSSIHLIFPTIPLLVAYPVCMSAIASAFVPAMLTFTLLSSMALVLGGTGTAPIFVACVSSYTTVCGLGLVQDLVSKAKH